MCWITALKLFKDFPDIPLITRHDSISTTEQYGDILYDEFFGINIKSEKEVW